MEFYPWDGPKAHKQFRQRGLMRTTKRRASWAPERDLRLSIILFSLLQLLRQRARKYPAFKKRLGEKNFSAQIKTMAIASVWIDEDLYDKDYVATRTTGFEKWRNCVRVWRRRWFFPILSIRRFCAAALDVAF